MRRLERQPLRNIVLLKHIEAFREHVSVAQVSDGSDTATLVLLDTTGSIYDRETYPQAAFAALISSDHPRLTRRLLSSVPAGGNVVFKLASDDDRDVVAERFPISRATSFLSFTGDEHATFVADSEVSVSTSASDVRFACSKARDIRGIGCFPCWRQTAPLSAFWNKTASLARFASPSRTIDRSGRSAAS